MLPIFTLQALQMSIPQMTIMGGTIAQLVNNRGIKADGKFTKHKHIKAVIVGQVPISKKALP